MRLNDGTIGKRERYHNQLCSMTHQALSSRSHRVGHRERRRPRPVAWTLGICIKATPSPLKILYMIINKSFPYPEIVTRPYKCVSRQHSNDTCATKGPMSIVECLMTWLTRGR